MINKKPNIFLILGYLLIFLNIMFFFVYLFGYIPFHYNDPDSYYYLAITKHISIKDTTILSFIAWYSGEYGIMIFLFIMSLFSSWLIYDNMKKFNKEFSLFISSLYLWMPLNLFMNGWYARADKNIIESFLFIIFILIIVTITGKDYIVNKKIIKWEFGFIILFFIFMILSFFLWEGYLIFAIYALLYIISYYLIKENKKIKYIKIGFLIILILIIIYKKIYNDNQITNELNITIYHLLIPEFILFVGLLIFIMFFYKNKYYEICILSIIVLLSIYFYPRLMVFLAVLIPILMIIIYHENKKAGIYFSTVLFLFSMLYIPYYINYYSSFDLYENEKKINISCDNCIIVADWSEGYFYQYYYNKSVMFKGSPDIISELDYLYYMNKSCDNCIYVYSNKDYDRFSWYRKKYNMPECEECSYILLYNPNITKKHFIYR